MKNGDGKARMVQCRIKSKVIGGTGLEVCDMKKFAGVVFVLLNTKRRTFYVLMPEDYEKTKKGGVKGRRGGAAKNQEHAIMYGEGSGRTEVQAWRAVADKIVELLPRSMTYTPSLSPSHQIEMTGMQIIQRVVAQRGNIFDNVIMASQQLD